MGRSDDQAIECRQGIMRFSVTLLFVFAKGDRNARKAGTQAMMGHCSIKSTD
jgi:hypothetical protein